MNYLKCIMNGSDLLENVRVREKSMRTIQYGVLLVAPMMKNDKEYRGALENISGQLGNARIYLRWFDDLSMLNHTLNYGWGSHESSKFMRMLNLIDNASGQLFYPSEHYAWAQDMGFISGNSSRAWNIGLLLWAVSLVSSIIRCFMRRSELIQSLSSTEDAKKRSSIKRLIMNENINLVMYSADLLNALNWLSFRPWGGKPFPSWMVGLLGFTSSFLGLYNLIKKK